MPIFLPGSQLGRAAGTHDTPTATVSPETLTFTERFLIHHFLRFDLMNDSIIDALLQYARKSPASALGFARRTAGLLRAPR